MVNSRMEGDGHSSSILVVVFSLNSCPTVLAWEQEAVIQTDQKSIYAVSTAAIRVEMNLIVPLEKGR
jgi:hypothetical protein